MALAPRAATQHAPPPPPPDPCTSGSEKLRTTVSVLLQILGNSATTSPSPSPSGLLSSSATSTSSTSSLTSLDLDPVCLDASHWLEVADTRHRYGTALRPYYDAWLAQRERGDTTALSDSFFDYLDGAGRDLDLRDHESCAAETCRYRRRTDPALVAKELAARPAAPGCPPKRKRAYSRAELEGSRLVYCDAERRRQYVVRVDGYGKLVWAHDGEAWRAGDVVHSGTCDKFIFVMGLDGTIYVNRKVKGRFHHSCFLAGGRVRAAGRIVVLDGLVVSLAPQSGHYKPDPRSIDLVVDVLGAHGVATEHIQTQNWNSTE